MKILIINGSPKNNGNTARSLAEAETIFAAEGIEVENVHIGDKMIRGCIACQACKKTGKCAIDDLVNEVAAKFETCDGLVAASPVYYASANGTLISLLDRLFYSARCPKTMKVGACVVPARRGGCSATFDELNKYFTISEMPVASSTYWNIIHGAKPGQAAEDAEGIRTVRNLAKNMSYMIKAFAAAKDAVELPEPEPKAFTNFIR